MWRTAEESASCSHWLCSHCTLSSSTSFPYQSWSFEKQPVPGETELSRDAPLLLGGTGGATAGSTQPSHTTQEAAASAKPLVKATPDLFQVALFSFEPSEVCCSSSERLFWVRPAPDMEATLEPEDKDEEDEDEDTPDLDRAP